MAMSDDKGMVIDVGRRATDGRLRASIFAGRLLALTLEGYGERAPTLLLTRDQTIRLQAALAELLPALQEQTQEPVAGASRVQEWQGAERRTTGELIG